MTKYRRRLVIIFSVLTIWLIGALWLIFNPKLLHALSQCSIVPIVIICLCAASICGCYLIARRMPRYTLGLVIVAVNFVLISIYGGFSFVFNLDNAWIDRMHYLIEILIPLSAVVIMWQAKKAKEDKTKIEKKEVN